MAGEWLLFEHSLHLRTQALKATAHVGHTCGDPDPCSCTQLDHWRRLSRIVRSKEPSAPFSTLIVARPKLNVDRTGWRCWFWTYRRRQRNTGFKTGCGN